MLLQLIKGGQEQRGTVNGGLSPGLLSRRVTSTGGRQLSDQPLAYASRNPSQPLQIVVPRTCDDSCTGRGKARVVPSQARAVLKGRVAGEWGVRALLCMVVVRGCTVMARKVV